MKPAAHVFVSYKSENSDAVRAVVERLLSHSVAVWFAEYDISIRQYLEDSDAEIDSAITEAIYSVRSGYALLFTNNKWSQSKWCRRELSHIMRLFPKDRIIHVCIPREQHPFDLEPRLSLVPTHIHQIGKLEETIQFVIRSIVGITAPPIGVTTPPAGGRQRFDHLGFRFSIECGWLAMATRSFDLLSPTRTFHLTGQLRSMRVLFRIAFSPFQTSLEPRGFTLRGIACRSRTHETMPIQDARDLKTHGDVDIGEVDLLDDFNLDPDDGEFDVPPTPKIAVATNENDRAIYREYARQGKRLIQSRGHVCRGLHLCHSSGTGTATTTFVGITIKPEAKSEPGVWARIYKVPLVGGDTTALGECELSFSVWTGVEEDEESFRRFCTIGHDMDAIARSLAYTGPAADRDFAGLSIGKRAAVYIVAAICGGVLGHFLLSLPVPFGAAVGAVLFATFCGTAWRDFGTLAEYQLRADRTHREP